MASVLDSIETILAPAVTGVTQTVTQAQQTAADAKQALADAKAGAAEAKDAVVGYGATTVFLQAVIAGAVIVCAYQLIKMNKRR